MPVLERLQRMDAGGDVFTTVRDFIANLHHVDPSVIEERDQIATHDRVATHAISEAVAPSHSPPSPPALATYVTLVNVTALAILAIATMPSPHHPHTLDLLPNAPLAFPVTPSLLAQVPLPYLPPEVVRTPSLLWLPFPGAAARSMADDGIGRGSWSNRPTRPTRRSTERVRSRFRSC